MSDAGSLPKDQQQIPGSIAGSITRREPYLRQRCMNVALPRTELVWYSDTTMGAVGFSPDRFAALSLFARDHFWFAGRQALVRKILDAELPREGRLALDVGCGPGLWLSDWRRYAGHVRGVDPYADTCETSPGPEVAMVGGTADALPAQSQEADLVVMLDVLEHIDDRVALDEVTRVLSPGGHVLVTVPAMPWLWSFRDEDAGHLRRYRRAELVALFEGAGLTVMRVQYYQSLLFPLVVLSRLAGRRSTRLRDKEDSPAGWVNATLRAITLFEVRCNLRLPFGSSLVLLARREG